MSKRITNVKKGGGAKKVLGAIAAVLVAVIVIGVVSLYSIVDSGFIQRHQVAMETENYKVTTAMMNYYFNTMYQNYSSSLKSMGLDTTKSLKEQDYISGDMTWFDYLMDMTKSNVEQVLVLCEAAKAEGFELSDDESHDHSPDETLAAMEAVAKQGGVDLEYYLEFYYGEGVNEKVFRQCYELSEIASHYSEHMTDSYSFTEDEWDTYYKENLDTFRKVDYLSYSFKVETAPAATDATDDEKAAADALKAEEAARLEGLAGELAACADADAFKAYVENYLTNDLYKDMTEEELAEKNVNIAEKVDDCLTTGATNSATSDLNTWLFADERVAYETYQSKNDAGDSFTVYMILPCESTEDLGYACMYRDTYNLKNIRYIPFTVADYNNSAEDAKAAAEEVFETYKDDPTEEKFIELADPETGYGDPNYEGGLVEGFDKGALGDEVDAWLYDSARVAGDCTVITVADKGSYMIYYVGDGETKWQAQADSALKEKQYSEDYEALKEQYPCKSLSKGLNLVSEVVLPDTTQDTQNAQAVQAVQG